MKLRIIDLLLVAVAAAGGVLAWQSGRERGRLGAIYERLERKTGDLAVGDPSMVYFRALETGDPRHFAWRVYYPPNFRQVWRQSWGGESSSSNTSAQEFIARVRFREGDSGNLELYTSYAGGSSRTGLGDPQMAAFLRERWGRLRVEQVGSSGLVALPPDRPATILRLTMPDDMAEEARRVLATHHLGRHVPEVFLLELNPAPPR
jgi:hypothetical protein